MWEFELEQRVVCIDDDFTFTAGEITPKLGQVYTIRQMMNDGDLCIRLYEIVNHERWYGDIYCECWFVSDHFRPLRPTNIDVFKNILTQVPSQAAEIKEDAYVV
jgi:hypothetical protein